MRKRRARYFSMNTTARNESARTGKIQDFQAFSTYLFFNGRIEVHESTASAMRESTTAIILSP